VSDTTSSDEDGRKGGGVVGPSRTMPKIGSRKISRKASKLGGKRASWKA